MAALSVCLGWPCLSDSECFEKEANLAPVAGSTAPNLMHLCKKRLAQARSEAHLAPLRKHNSVTMLWQCVGIWESLSGACLVSFIAVVRAYDTWSFGDFKGSEIPLAKLSAAKLSPGETPPPTVSIAEAASLKSPITHCHKANLQLSCVSLAPNTCLEIDHLPLGLSNALHGHSLSCGTSHCWTMQPAPII